MNTAATQPQTGSLNLGMIGNCAISALIDDHARMVWRRPHARQAPVAACCGPQKAPPTPTAGCAWT